MVSVICGTNRTNSNSSKFARFIYEDLKANGKEARILDLADLPEDFVFSNEVYGRVNTELLKVQDEHVTEADRFIFVLPEYNGGFPGVAKAFLDSFSPSRIHNKKALLVGISSGRAGNLRGLEHFTGVLNYLRVTVNPFKPAVPHCNEAITDGKVTDDKVQSLLRSSVESFLKL